MAGHDKSTVDRRYRIRRDAIDRRIQYVLRAMEADPAAGISALAAMVNLSVSRLSHLFKVETHRSLHSHLANRRMEKAAQLLELTETPVKEISYIVGYSHSASFVRAFRKRFGCTPVRYRNDGCGFSTGNSWFG